MVCCIGPATRLVQFLVGLDKEYLATVRLGYATDTQDGTGKRITPVCPPSNLSLEELRRTLHQFTGPQLQMPPMFSAKKVGGERLYRAAREGREVERDPVSIVVHSIALIGEEAPGLSKNEDGTAEFNMQVRCSSGTYVRTLAHDLGERLGVGAHLVGLRRISVGHFHLTHALTLDELETISREALVDALISPYEMLMNLPVLALDDEETSRITNGRALSLSPEQAAVIEPSAHKVRLSDSRGTLVAVGDFDREAGLINPRVVLAG
ncbi:MAG: tRNA pseudouridine(55) synthase TruB [Acidobacteria bacterium]|nr:MAG: tRNA pseudouridine(55) synthase TruB [Acidobacteriota bacterium]